MARFTRLVAKLGRPLAAECSAHQLALAVSIGIAYGLVPKVNLIALALLLSLFVLRVNLAVGLVMAAAATFAGFVLDPYFHWLGDHLLSAERLQPLFLSIYRLPWGPWTEINNTVVAGSVTVSLLQALPAYLFSRAFFAKQAARFRDHWFVRSLGVGPSSGWRI